MRKLEIYFELAKLKSQAFELCLEKEDTIEKSQKKALLLRLSSITEKSYTNTSSFIKNQIKDYLDNFIEKSLYKNENFKKELSNISIIIDELKLTYYKEEVETEADIFNEQLKSLEYRMKSTGIVLEAFFKSRLFFIQLAILIAFLGFAFYGILKIQDFEVNVVEISETKVEEAKKEIDEATQKTKNDIEDLNKEYKTALYDLINDNTSKYDAEMKEYALSQKNRIKSSVTDYISEIKTNSKPDIEDAIDNLQKDIVISNENLKTLKYATYNNDSTLQVLENNITGIKENLVVIDTTLTRFKTSTTLNVVDKISTVLNISKVLMWVYLGLLVIMLVWIIVLSLKLKRLKNKSSSQSSRLPIG